MKDFELSNYGLFDSELKIDSFISAVEWALILLDLQDKPATLVYNSGGNKYGLNVFNGANLWANNVEDIDKNNSFYFAPQYVDLNLHTLGIDTKDINFKILNIDNEKEVKVSLLQYVFMPKSKMRGLKSVPYPVIAQRVAFLGKTEKWFTQENYFKLFKNNENFLKSGGAKRLVEFAIKEFNIKDVESAIKFASREYHFLEMVNLIHNTSFIDKNTIKNEFGQANRNWLFCLTTALTEFYQWHLYIREKPDSIGFKVPVAPESFEDVFRLRDTGSTKTGRKKAILHWVEAHIRILNNSQYSEEQREVLVRRHLRGETKFKWNGMEVHIIPSGHDLKKYKTSKKFIKT